MSSFDTDRGVIILEASQWDVLERMVTGPVAERATYAEGASPVWKTSASSTPTARLRRPERFSRGSWLPMPRYSLRRLDPTDTVTVRDLVISLASPPLHHYAV